MWFSHKANAFYMKRVHKVHIVYQHLLLGGGGRTLAMESRFSWTKATKSNLFAKFDVLYQLLGGLLHHFLWHSWVSLAHDRAAKIHSSAAACVCCQMPGNRFKALLILNFLGGAPLPRRTLCAYDARIVGPSAINILPPKLCVSVPHICRRNW